MKNETIIPKFMSYAVTWRCNNKCKMCKTWETKKVEEMNLNGIEQFLDDNYLHHLTEVIFTGGEPTLKEDLAAIAKIFNKKTKAEIGITTNGFLVEKILNFTEELRKDSVPLGIYISIDGPNPKIHDYIRGVKGSFERVTELMKRLTELKKIYPKLTLSTGMTLTKDNLYYAFDTKKLCESFGLDFGIRLNEIGAFFHNETLNLLYSNQERVEIIKVLDQVTKPSLKDYYERLKKYLYTTKYSRFDCAAGEKSFLMDPTGKIYPCANYTGKLLMGDVKFKSFRQIWNSEGASKVRKQISGCYQCLNACQYNWSKNLRAT